MSNEKFIPGPWHADALRTDNYSKFSVWNAGERYQICASYCDNQKLFDTMETNANLIAAAPNMYYKLKDLAETLRQTMPLVASEIDAVLEEALNGE